MDAFRADNGVDGVEVAAVDAEVEVAVAVEVTLVEDAEEERNKRSTSLFTLGWLSSASKSCKARTAFRSMNTNLARLRCCMWRVENFIQL